MQLQFSSITELHRRPTRSIASVLSDGRGESVRCPAKQSRQNPLIFFPCPHIRRACQLASQANHI
jgi:hypothetical protein